MKRRRDFPRHGRIETIDRAVLVRDSVARAWASAPAAGLFTRAALFPRFDPEALWALRRAPLQGKHFGHPDFVTKTIWIRAEYWDRLKPVAFADLIAHAASGSPNHDDAWRDEMVGAAARAREQAIAPLATELEAWIGDQYGRPGYANEEVLVTTAPPSNRALAGAARDS